MNRLIAANVKLEERRKALETLLDLETRSETWQADVDAAKKAVQEARAEMLAVAELEPEIPEHRQDTKEGAELRSMLDRANVGEFFDAVLEHRNIDGVFRELQEHYGMAANQFPLGLLEQRAVTPAPGNVGQNQQPIVPYVFPDSVASFLAVDMPTVGVGEAVFPVLTSELNVRTPNENADADETTGAFSADVLSPSRLQASFFYSREDRARFAGMDSALRENLSMGLADGLDDEIVSGANGLLTGTNLSNHNVTSVTNFTSFVEDFGYGRVDGQYASNVGDLRIVMGTASYAHAGSTYRGNNSDSPALDRLMAVTGGVRVSAHVPAASSNRQNAVIRLGQRRDMVAPIWNGITIIPDEVTKAKQGQIVVTAVMLHAVKILRTDGFYKQMVQVA